MIDGSCEVIAVFTLLDLIFVHQVDISVNWDNLLKLLLGFLIKSNQLEQILVVIFSLSLIFRSLVAADNNTHVLVEGWVPRQTGAFTLSHDDVDLPELVMTCEVGRILPLDDLYLAISNSYREHQPDLFVEPHRTKLEVLRGIFDHKFRS